MEVGDTIGKYRLTSRLGRGGMGEVWLGTSSGFGGFTKTVVLKTLLPELASDPLFVEMLAHEARICAKLSHPNLIEVFDFSEHDGIYLLAMEHVVGRPLSHIMKAARARNVAIPAWFALRVAWECCRGLECAHEQGVIHCDLSPSNVMVSFTGVTKILDFGVAHSATRGNRADRLKGKYPYMAPERIKSLATDRRTDVYALGVMLYLLFAGRLPFVADTDEALLMKIVEQTPRPPSYFSPVDPVIEQIILRAMQPDPDARYQSISEVLAELSPCLDGHLGAYGQHDVAAFVCGLFDAPDVPRHLRAAGGTREDDVTRPPISRPTASASSTREEALDSVDVVIESSVVDETPEPIQPPTGALLAGARGSSSMRPLSKPLTAVFSEPSARASAFEDPRTSVQSLFGARPSAFGPSRVFDRAPLEALSPEPAPAAGVGPGAGPRAEDTALGSAPGRRPEYRWLEPARPEPAPAPAPEPDARDARDAREPERDAVNESSRGVFGGYSSARKDASTPEWPWAASRTKSE